MEVSGESGVHMEPAEDDLGSTHSQETAFSQTVDMKSSHQSAPAAKVKFADDTEASDESQGEENTETEPATEAKKQRYPYGPLFFIMTATAGQR